MSTKENKEVAVEKLENAKSADAKCELKGTKRPAEVSKTHFPICRIFVFRHRDNSVVVSKR